MSHLCHAERHRSGSCRRAPACLHAAAAAAPPARSLQTTRGCPGSCPACAASRASPPSDATPADRNPMLVTNSLDDEHLFPVQQQVVAADDRLVCAGCQLSATLTRHSSCDTRSASGCTLPCPSSGGGCGCRVATASALARSFRARTRLHCASRLPRYLVSSTPT